MATNPNAPDASAAAPAVTGSAAGGPVGDPAGRLATQLGSLLHARVDGLVRLSGGASRETWSFDAVDTRTSTRRELILRRDPPGAARIGGMELEARALRAAASAGMPVPAVRGAGPADPNRLDTGYLLMDRVRGETIARKILRDPQYARAREVLPAQMGRAIARLHSLPLDAVAGLEPSDPYVRYRTTWDEIRASTGAVSPVFEWAFRWLDEHRPQPGERVVVHGDFRLGNVIVDEDGLASVLDWELVHIGDPLEDLAWPRVRAWRFGGAGEVAGVGDREALFSAYEEAGGRPVDRDAAHWWLVLGTLMWGVMCGVQYSAQRAAGNAALEPVAIGRRTAEQEHDLVQLLMPDAAQAAQSVDASAAAVDGGHARGGDLFGHPTIDEVVAAVRSFLEHDVLAATTGRVQFHARVAANALGIVARELASGAAANAAHTIALAALGFADDAALADAIRSGTLDYTDAALQRTLAAGVAARLAVANPKYA